MSKDKQIRNQLVRERVIAFMDKYGSTTKFIAKKAGLSYPHFTLFVAGNINISHSSMNKVERFIDGLENETKGAII
ncbi:hypothetical protein [Priestia megaterium]|uniref:hypothetical protein n=1 Tax=Priestia megaterium TaxID=1404 RepID=UPI00064C7953|nr:hypothetical protein [Priestia megaterium]KLV28661.1 hypothetical protein ABW04_28545 [Priestia megaterium]